MIFLDITNEGLLNNFYDSAKVELIAFGNGKAFAIPTNAWSMGIFVNADMFKQNGIDIPENYDEIIAAANKFKEKGISPFVQGMKDSWCVNHQCLILLQNNFYITSIAPITILLKNDKFK